jgi:hypothetical protein
MHPYSNPTRRNMEDDLTIFENGRRPQFFSKEDDLIFLENVRLPQKKLWNHKQLKVKINNILKMEDNLIFIKKEDDLNFFKTKDDLKKI